MAGADQNFRSLSVVLATRLVHYAGVIQLAFYAGIIG